MTALSSDQCRDRKELLRRRRSDDVEANALIDKALGDHARMLGEGVITRAASLSHGRVPNGGHHRTPRRIVR